MRVLTFVITFFIAFPMTNNNIPTGYVVDDSRRQTAGGTRETQIALGGPAARDDRDAAREGTGQSGQSTDTSRGPTHISRPPRSANVNPPADVNVNGGSPPPGSPENRYAVRSSGDTTTQTQTQESQNTQNNRRQAWQDDSSFSEQEVQSDTNNNTIHT